MSEEHHAADHFGEECPGCGTVHRVLESLPDQPLTTSQIEELRDSENIAFIRGLALVSGGLVGYDTDEEMTEDIVLSTESSTKVLSRYDGTGWVVDIEEPHHDGEDPAVVGEETWMKASQHLSTAMQEAFDG